jgi:sec-independent protein translocase protein TatA
MGLASWWHILIVLVLFVLLFGRGKISELMGDVAQGIKSFKKGITDEDEAEPAASRAKPKLIEHEAAKAPARRAKQPARAKTARAKTTRKSRA